MPEIRTIQLNPPQPCGLLNPTSGTICGAPAHNAAAEAAPMQCAGADGYLLVLPICDSCARSMAVLYAGAGDILAAHRAVAAARDCGDLVVVSHTISLPETPAPAVLRAAADLLDQSAARMTRDAGVLRERADEIAARN